MLKRDQYIPCSSDFSFGDNLPSLGNIVMEDKMPAWIRIKFSDEDRAVLRMPSPGVRNSGRGSGSP